MRAGTSKGREVYVGRFGQLVFAVVAIALVVVAAVYGFRLIREDNRAPDTPAPAATADQLGCPAGIYANTDFALDGDDGGVLIVCHYEKLSADPSSGQSHRLVSASRLTPRKSAAVRDAVSAAPRGQPEFEACPTGDESPGEFFLVQTPTQVAFWVYNAECGDNGVLEAGQGGGVVHRHDTAAVLAALGSEYGPLGPS